jgi:hypothetical protein
MQRGLGCSAQDFLVFRHFQNLARTLITLEQPPCGGAKVSGSTTMFKTNFKETAVAVVATIVLTATAVGAAVGPARAIETAPSAALSA